MSADLRIELDCYEGPLDLLVVLARQGEVDLLQIAIGEIARRFAEGFQVHPSGLLDDAGEFLVLVSTLMELKSRLLLPSVDAFEEPEFETETRRELVRQLLEYKRFREAASLLGEKARAREQRLARVSSELGNDDADPAQRPIRELELWDLVSAFSRLMKETIVPGADSILIDTTPIAAYMERLRGRVLAAGRMDLRELFGDRNTKSQLVGKFLALLELIKLHQVWVELGETLEEIFVLAQAPDFAGPPGGEDSMPMADETVPPDAMPRSADSRADSAKELLDDAGSAWDDFESLLEDEEPPAPGD